MVFAGGQLSGEVKPTPDNWTQLDNVDLVQIETQPSDPYSVNVWAAAVDKDLYVAAGDDGANWTEHIEIDANVRVRGNSSIYELRARLVSDAAERARVSKAYVGKYGLDQDDNWVMDGMIFRLDRR